MNTSHPTLAMSCIAALSILAAFPGHMVGIVPPNTPPPPAAGAKPRSSTPQPFAFIATTEGTSVCVDSMASEPNAATLCNQFLASVRSINKLLDVVIAPDGTTAFAVTRHADHNKLYIWPSPSRSTAYTSLDDVIHARYVGSNVILIEYQNEVRQLVVPGKSGLDLPKRIVDIAVLSSGAWMARTSDGFEYGNQLDFANSIKLDPFLPVDTSFIAVLASRDLFLVDSLLNSKLYAIDISSGQAKYSTVDGYVVLWPTIADQIYVVKQDKTIGVLSFPKESPNVVVKDETAKLAKDLVGIRKTATKPRNRMFSAVPPFEIDDQLGIASGIVSGIFDPSVVYQKVIFRR